MRLAHYTLLCGTWLTLGCSDSSYFEKEPEALKQPIADGPLVCDSNTHPLAFPGAEGAARCAKGGRGGSVAIVTNLNASGAGSLYDALYQGGSPATNRIIVFAVSGAIDLTDRSNPAQPKGGVLRIDGSNITIAGQTAPGDGIVITGGSLQVRGDNIILRHLRLRRGVIRSGYDHGDGLSIEPASSIPTNIILDHISASWATDENLSVRDADKTTLQWGLVAEGLNYTNGSASPNNHGFGSIWSAHDGSDASLYHTLYAHNNRRSPHVGNYTGDDVPTMDFRSNVIYDWQDFASHTNGGVPFKMNWVGNTYKPGPSTPMGTQSIFFTFDNPSTGSRLHQSDNWIGGSAAGTSNITLPSGASASTFLRTAPFPSPSFDPPADAATNYTTVLSEAGATLPARDLVDQRIVASVSSGTGSLINTEADVAPSSWTTRYYQSVTAPADSDGDGLPDYWEKQHSSPASTTSLSSTVDDDMDKYVNIEEYVNNTLPNAGNKPVVYVAAVDSRARFGDHADKGRWRIYRTGSVTSALTVSYTLSGSASLSTGYSLSAAMAAALGLPSGMTEGTVTIPAGERSVEIELTAVPTSGSDSQAILQLATSSFTSNPGSYSYFVGCPSLSLVGLMP